MSDALLCYRRDCAFRRIGYLFEERPVTELELPILTVHRLARALRVNNLDALARMSLPVEFLAMEYCRTSTGPIKHQAVKRKTSCASFVPP
eukprot:scaffold32435_cov23-Tisochrysis_lutea.AAC.2